MNCLVIGLGRFGGGVGVTNWLASNGAYVTVTDMAEASDLVESIDAISPSKPTLKLGGHGGVNPGLFDLVIVNPAVRKDRSALFAATVDAGVPWTTEINLFCALCPSPVIGVTGTFGKSTTCAMLAHVLSQAGAYDVRLGGNIGRSLLAELPAMHARSPRVGLAGRHGPNETGESKAKRQLVVLELSESQLDDLPDLDWGPETAVITNLQPHHLDRYETAASYYSRKMNVIHGRQTRRILAGPMEAEAESMFHATVRDLDVPIERMLAGGSPPTGSFDLLVPGNHNLANAAVAQRVAVHCGVSADDAASSLASFPGLPHRLAYIGSWNDIRFVNDSKSTAPRATLAALEAYDVPVVLIVGGQTCPDFDAATFAAAVASKCRAMITMGEHGREAHAAVERFASDGGRMERTIRTAITLRDAVASACRSAVAGDVVLFSPGGPSFDTHRNYQERGNEFIAIVRQIIDRQIIDRQING